MDLREYLFRKRKSIATFSREIDCSRGHISKIVNGDRKPGKKLAKIIERATAGWVSVGDLKNPVGVHEE